MQCFFAAKGTWDFDLYVGKFKSRAPTFKRGHSSFNC